MATKSTRYIDPQGRIIIPKHIRKALNLNTGNVVEVSLDDDGTIRVRASYERCTICGEGVEGRPVAEVTVGSGRKLVCYNCSQAVARSMMK